MNAVEIIIKGVDKSSPAFKSAELNLENFRKSLSKIGGSLLLAGAAAGAAVGAAVKSQIDAADELGKLAQKTGIATEKLSALKLLAQQNEVPIEKLGVGFKELGKSIIEASNGNEKTQATFKALGVSVTDANGKIRTSDQVFRSLSDAFARTNDGAAKSAIAVELFGKAGADLIPALNGGSAALDDATEKVRIFGLEISGETAQQADEFNDSLSDVGLALQGVAATIMKEVLPWLTEMSKRFVAWIKDSGAVVSSAESIMDAFKGMAVAIASVKAAFEVVGRVIGSVVAIIYEGLVNSVKAVIQLFGIWGNTVVGMVKGLWELLKAIGGVGEAMGRLIEGDFTGAWDAAKSTMGEVGDKILDIQDTFVKAFKDSGSVVVGTYQKDWNMMKSIAGSTSEEIKKEIESLGDFSSGLWAPKKSNQTVTTNFVEKTDIDPSGLQAPKGVKQPDLGEFEPGKSGEKFMDDRRRALEFMRQIGQEAHLEMLTGFEREKLAAQQQFDDKVLKLQEFQALKVLSEEETNTAIVQAQEGFNARLNQIEKQGMDARLAMHQQVAQGISGIFSNLAGAAQAFGKKGFAAFKALSAAQALIDTYAAAIAAYRAMASIPIIGPALGIAAAAAATAYGLARVAQIKGMQYAGQAHAGLDFVPSESTFLLQRGERVVQPEQNVQLTKFLNQQEQGGGVSSQSPSMFHIVLNMDGRQLWESIYQASRNGSLEISQRAIV